MAAYNGVTCCILARYHECVNSFLFTRTQWNMVSFCSVNVVVHFLMCGLCSLQLLVPRCTLFARLWTRLNTCLLHDAIHVTQSKDIRTIGVRYSS
jgi:hypothetical protein